MTLSSWRLVSRRRIDCLRSMRTAISGLALIMSPNISPLMTMRSPSSTTSAEAERGSRSRMAISPKKSPFSRTASVVSPSFTFFLMATRPDWMMFMSSPSSPSWKRTCPLSKWVRNLANGFFSAVNGGLWAGSLPKADPVRASTGSARVSKLLGDRAPLAKGSLDGQEGHQGRRRPPGGTRVPGQPRDGHAGGQAHQGRDEQGLVPVQEHVRGLGPSGEEQDVRAQPAHEEPAAGGRRNRRLRHGLAPHQREAARGQDRVDGVEEV